eukprot:COSAG06_NODE_523_length_14708_cov_16.526593_3_plen_163_part_00
MCSTAINRLAGWSCKRGPSAATAMEPAFFTVRGGLSGFAGKSRGGGRSRPMRSVQGRGNPGEGRLSSSSSGGSKNFDEWATKYHGFRDRGCQKSDDKVPIVLLLKYYTYNRGAATQTLSAGGPGLIAPGGTPGKIKWPELGERSYVFETDHRYRAYMSTRFR